LDFKVETMKSGNPDTLPCHKYINADNDKPDTCESLTPSK